MASALSPARSIVVSLAGPVDRSSRGRRGRGRLRGRRVADANASRRSSSRSWQTSCTSTSRGACSICCRSCRSMAGTSRPLRSGLRVAARRWRRSCRWWSAGVITVTALAGRPVLHRDPRRLPAWPGTGERGPRCARNHRRRLLARAWNRLYYDPSAATETATAIAADPASHDIRFEAIEIIGWAALASGSTAGVRDAFSQLGDGTVGSRLFRACARLSLDGDGGRDGRGPGGRVRRSAHLAVMAIASRV